MDVSERTIGGTLVVGAAALWGTNAILGKLALRAGFSLTSILAVRFLIAGALVVAGMGVYGMFARWRQPDDAVSIWLSPRQAGVAFTLGAVGYAGMLALYFWALHFMTAGTVALLSYTYPIFVLILSTAVLNEYITRRVMFATGGTLVGVGLIAGANPVGVTAFGALLAVSTGIIHAVYIVVSRVTLANVDSRVLTAYTLPATAVAYTFLAVVQGEVHPPPTTYAWSIVLAFVAFGTIIPILSFFAGLARIDANRTGLLSMIEPVVTVALGVAMLGEPLTVPAVFGGAFILLSVYLVHVERA